MPLHVLVSGVSGLIGTALVRQLAVERTGYSFGSTSRWTGRSELGFPTDSRLDLSSIGQVDAAIHLSGENIASRWTDKTKRHIRESRVLGTELLSRALPGSNPAQGPGLRFGDRYLWRSQRRGTHRGQPHRRSAADFLVSVCRGVEAAAEPARQAGIRVVHPRFAVVLGTSGGRTPSVCSRFSRWALPVESVQALSG